jgi:hypothetical protein
MLPTFSWLSTCRTTFSLPPFEAMRSFLSSKPPNDEVEAATQHSADDTDKEVGVKNQDVPTDSETDADEISLNAQPGVQNIEAITKVWSRTHLVIAYIM